LLAPGARFDTATADSISKGVTCYTFPRYIVVNREPVDSLGSDTFVRRRKIAAGSREQCGTDSLPGDFIARNEWAEYYAGLDGRWLFLDSGTGPERSVIIYDVDARRRIAGFGGEVAGWRDSTTLLVWVTAGDSVPRSLCPKIPESFGASADAFLRSTCAPETWSQPVTGAAPRDSDLIPGLSSRSGVALNVEPVSTIVD
jgi:hypothetical protein